MSLVAAVLPVCLFCGQRIRLWKRDAEGSGELKEGDRDVFKRTGGNFGIGGGMGISSHRGSFLLSYTFVLSETDREGENRNGGCSFFYCSRVGDRSTF